MSAPTRTTNNTSKTRLIDSEDNTLALRTAVHYIDLFYKLSKAAEKAGFTDEARGFTLAKTTIWRNGLGKKAETFLPLTRSYLIRALASEQFDLDSNRTGFTKSVEKSIRIIEESLKTISS